MQWYQTHKNMPVTDEDKVAYNSYHYQMLQHLKA